MYKNESQVLYADAVRLTSKGYKHQVTATYYDKNTAAPADFTPTYLRNRVAYTTYQQETSAAAGSPVQQTHYSYDVHGNVNSLLQVINHDGNMLAKRVDYEYDLISGKVNKVYYQKDQPDQLIHVYAYDGDNRIIEVKTSTDNVVFTKEAEYDYYAHGILARTKLGELTVETEKFAYTVQGWMKQMQAEAFSYALGYNENDYKAIGGTGVNILATPIAVVNGKSKGLYNGNIAAMTSKTPAIASTAWQQQYSYDQLNRITGSNTPGAGNAYKTNYSYDANGNIKALGRYDAASTKFDTLVYNYETKANGYLRTTNRLRWVDDLAGASATTADIEDQNTDNYSYDAVGNLLADKQEEIDHIEWTVSGKVRRVVRTPLSQKPDLEFEYDASGQRIAKKVIKKNGDILNTYYLRDASGNVMSVYSYSGTDNDPQLSEQYLYGAARLGVYTPGANVLSKTRGFGRKSYEISDHLGNVRATLSDYRRAASAATVNSATDYYPFGMIARTYASSQKYRYGFNGKEDDDDLTGGDYDFGARIYDSRIGRTLSIDPAWKEYPWLSGYSFLNNNPITHIDDDGKRFYFVGGAGNDADGWNYIQRFAQIFTNKGIQGFTRVNASGGKLKDIAFVTSYKNFSQMGPQLVKRSDGRGYDVVMKRRDHVMIQRAVDGILADLAQRPLKEGEQLNLAGYSYGSVLQAHVALRLADKGIKVDNLVLIGSPISDDSPLYKELTTNANIGKVIRHDIPNDKLSNPKSEAEYIEGGKQNSTDEGPHFDLARPGADADKKIAEVADKIITQGVK